MSARLILLVGPRGSGKTTVGRALAARLGWAFADADEHIEAAVGKTIAAIFAAEGQGGFRDREAAALAELCGRTDTVVATGGGAVLRPANRELLRRSGFVVWLNVTPEVAWERLQADPTTAARRPNLTATGGLDEVRTLIAAREPLYRQTAHLAVPAGLSPDAAAAAILCAWTGSSSSPPPSGAASPSSSG
ncbi:MAG: shikimate kinase AroL [Gemmataceae bacterium]|nr:shikimate kinase AroL [Gemmataceae bacterium]